jgi:hypothetical protein
MGNGNPITSADPRNYTSSQSGIGDVINIGTEASLRNETLKANIDSASNLGSQNPFKKYNPKSLFYDGAKLDSNIATGSFLFYAFDGSRGTNQIVQDVYNNSESPAINQKISSPESKNPSASFLVRQTIELVNRNLAGSSTGRGITNNIVGGKSAPYYWKDFLYCKHYGKIPNNYMLTLRRYASPMNDNLSLPRQVKDNPKLYEQGAGVPVSQIVSWVGGDTGNKLSEVLKFSTGLKFKSREQDITVTQNAFSNGFFQDILQLEAFTKAVQTVVPDYDPNSTPILDILDVILGSSTDQSFKESIAPRINYQLLNKLVGSESEPGPLSGFNIFTPLDVITSTYVRDTGLDFSWGGLVINGSWELTSVGNVNTKAAMLDIMGNILSMATNYGNFISPFIKYNSEFPAIKFPGGDAGLEDFYRNPAKFFNNFIKDFNESATGTAGGDLKVSLVNNKQQISNIIASSKAKNASSLNTEGSSILERAGFSVLNYDKGNNFASKVQLPQSVLTGAPIGEWHLVVGNPMNPIAMIGNLICKSVEITFGDQLGPDDFPTEINAKFTLEHARPRERGEIESIFNRGDGRLYQSTVRTQSENNSAAAITTTDGTRPMDGRGRITSLTARTDTRANLQ